MKNAVPQTNVGTKNVDTNICRIQTFPPCRAYNEPPKYPFTGDVAAYTKIAVDNIDPRLFKPDEKKDGIRKYFVYFYSPLIKIYFEKKERKKEFNLLCVQLTNNGKCNNSKYNCCQLITGTDKR